MFLSEQYSLRCKIIILLSIHTLTSWILCFFILVHHVKLLTQSHVLKGSLVPACPSTAPEPPLVGEELALRALSPCF